MGHLPKSKVPTKLLDFDGEKVSVKGLTRAETVRIGQLANSAPEYVDTVVIALGCDVTEAEAEEWLKTAALQDTQRLVEAVLELSGLGDETPKGLSENSTPEK